MQKLTWKKTDLGVGKRGVRYETADGRFTILPNPKDMQGYALYEGGAFVSGHLYLADAKHAAAQRP